MALATCTSGGTADATDSKSVGGDTVWVQIPPGALEYKKGSSVDAELLFTL